MCVWWWWGVLVMAVPPGSDSLAPSINRLHSPPSSTLSSLSISLQGQSLLYPATRPWDILWLAFN